jgi:hypothetical protein
MWEQTSQAQMNSLSPPKSPSPQFQQEPRLLFEFHSLSDKEKFCSPNKSLSESGKGGVFGRLAASSSRLRLSAFS